METNQQNRLLGEEKISRLLLRFSIPCVMGLLISAFYNIVDQIFIGNSELGYLGNAATGVSFPVICIANAFAFCIGDGAASFLSICAGRRDTEGAHKCVGGGITATAIVGLVLMTICLVFATPLMSLFGASDQTIGMAVEYFRILSIFFPFYLLLNVMNSMIRADGSPTYAMIAMLSGAVINIILDPVFIFVLKWGIAGAAWATVIGQVASFGMCVAYFFRPKTFKLTAKSFVPDRSVLRRMISLGLSTFVTQISIVVVSLASNVVLAHYGALSQYGPDIPISVFSIQTKVYTIVCNIVVGIVLGGQPILGYNYGARKLDRVKETYRIVLIASLITGIAATAIFELRPQWIIGLFGGGNALYEEFAIKTFRIYLSMTTITCLVKMTAIFFQSIGKPISAVVASMIRDIVCFTPLAILLPQMMEKEQAGNGIHGILYAAPISDLVAVVVVVILTVSFFRQLNQEMARLEMAAGEREHLEHGLLGEGQLAADQLVEGQPESGGLAAESKTAREKVEIKPSRSGAIITIAREHGTGGKRIGELVASMMAIPYYYKTTAALAAQASGLSQGFLEELNTNAPAILHQLYLSTNAVQQAVVAQEKIIQSIADNGSCVIVGRSADHILKDYDNVIRVFLYAPDEYRVKNIMEVYGDTREEAEIHMHRSDAARSAYYRNLAGKNWGDPHNYDLCIDASIGREECARLITEYAKRRQ